MNGWKMVNGVAELPVGTWLVLLADNHAASKLHVCNVVLNKAGVRIETIASYFSYDCPQVIAFRELPELDNGVNPVINYVTLHKEQVEDWLKTLGYSPNKTKCCHLVINPTVEYLNIIEWNITEWEGTKDCVKEAWKRFDRYGDLLFLSEENKNYFYLSIDGKTILRYSKQPNKSGNLSVSIKFFVKDIELLIAKLQ